MAKKKNNKKQPWSNSLESRKALYKGVNPSADFDPLSIVTQTIGYLGGFRTGQGMPEDEARWAAYLGLPYDKTYAPDSKIRFEGDENYPNRQYQGLSKRAKEEVKEDIIPKARRIKNRYNKGWIQVLDTKPNSEYNDATIYHDRQNYLGDLGKFGIREVGNSGIYEVGDKYDFPALIPIPNRNEGTELMIRDTIWSDRANPKLYEEELLRRSNKHSLGGWFAGLGSKLDGWNSNTTDNFFNSKFGKGLSGFGINASNIGGLANTAATAIGGLLAGKNKTGVGSAMQTVGSLASNIPGIGGLIGAGVNLAGGLVNAAFGSNINKEFVDQTEQAARQQANYVSGASNNEQLLADYSGLSFLGDIKKSDVGSDGWFSNKASKETKRLNTLVDDANMKALASLENTAENIDTTNDLLLLANYTAYGGPLNMKYTGVMSPFGNQFKDGGIYIKPSKRGTFTAAAKKRGVGVQEFASKVLANKEDYSPAMVKKANFARNARKWKHADGGNLFTNGVTIIGNGGTHENNPLEGVPMGIDNQGIPNLVEEGEVIYNDYVFSNRLRVPKEVRQKYKLRGVTFADAAKQIQKESEERPNDLIAKDTMNAIMSGLTQEQEMIRAKKENNKYAKGGRLVNKFAFGDNINIIDNPYSVYTTNPTDNFNYNDWFTVDKNNLGRVTSYSDPYKNFYFTADQARAYAANNPNDESLKSYLARGNKLEDLTDEDVQKGSLDNMHGWLHKARARAAASERVTNPSFIPTRNDILANIDSILSKPSATSINRNIKAKIDPIQLEQEIINESPLPSETSDDSGIVPMRNHWLRYAPIIGAGLSVLGDITGGNEPYYGNADLYERAIEGSNRPVRFKPVGNYLKYNPFDRDYYINKLNANTAAGKRAVMNTSGGNRAAALAGILATDYNYGNQLGDLARKAEEYNLAQRQQVEDFNRATNIFNSEMGLKASIANAQQSLGRAKLYGNLAQYRDTIREKNRAEKSLNLTNFIQGLGDLGREITDRDKLRWLADLGVLAYNPKGEYTKGEKKSNKSSKGGKLNRKKRGGFTI